MKQSILCTNCAKELMNLSARGHCPGEHNIFIFGLAKRDYTCDFSNEPISAGDRCCANSIWADHGRIPYYKWESDFLMDIEWPEPVIEARECELNDGGG